MAVSKKGKFASVTIAIVAAVILPIWFFYFLQPRRNVFGSAASERLVYACKLADGRMKVSLYRGEPAATDAFWHSVDISEGSDRAVQIFYTYSEPEIIGIECKADGIEVSLAGQPSKVFSLDEISALKIHPKGLYKGKERTH